MKLPAACLLAVALVFRAAPVCASPVTADIVAVMPGCDDAASSQDEQSGHKGGDAARA